MSTWKVNDVLAGPGNFASIMLARRSQASDECVLRILAPFDSADLFTHGSTVTLKKDDAPYFFGRCETDPRSGLPSGESHTVRILGPWWYLENCIYRQTWTAVTDPTATPPTTAEVPTTYVVLGMKQDGTRLATGAMMIEALNFAIDRGAPLQLGSIMAGIQIPMEDANDITVAEVIHRCLRWTPDAVVWFDYSASPPAINIARRGAMTAVSLSAVATAGTNVSSVEVEPCHALKLDGVRLYFTVDSNPFPSVVQEAGTLTSFQVLECTIRLAGAKQNILLNKVETIDLPVDQIDSTWWKIAHPELWSVDDLVLHNGNLGDVDDLGKQLLSGEITLWMKDHQGIHANAATAKVQADFTLGGTQYFNQPLTFKYIATDAESKTYTFGEGGTPPETPPTGLAAAILAAAGTLHYQGTWSVVEDECGRGASLMGKKLNLTGGLSAWASMGALIIGVTEDIFSGRTKITFGPPPCLGAGDLRALAMMNRIRLPAGSAGAKKAGGNDVTNSPTLGGSGATNTLSGGLPLVKKFVVTNATKSVTIDPADSSDVIFNLLFVTDYGTSGAALHSIPVMRKGNVLVLTGDPTDLSLYDCP